MIPSKRVFISHSSSDKRFARMLENHLPLYGISPWLDETELLLGDHLKIRIEEAIKNSEFLVLILSSNSLSSNWVQKELEIALLEEQKSGRTIILPILLEKVSMPKPIEGRIYADFTNLKVYHKGFHMLLKLLGHQHIFRSPLTIYSNALELGWENWSWDCESHEMSTECIRTGAMYSFSAKLQPYGGLAFAFRSAISTKGYKNLEFYCNGGNTGKQKLTVNTNDQIGNGVRRPYVLKPLKAGEWKHICIPLKLLDSIDIFIVKICITDSSGKGASTFFLDNLKLTA